MQFRSPFCLRKLKECPKTIGKMDFGIYQIILRSVMFRSPEFLLVWIRLLDYLGIQNSETLSRTDIAQNRDIFKRANTQVRPYDKHIFSFITILNGIFF